MHDGRSIKTEIVAVLVLIQRQQFLGLEKVDALPIYSIANLIRVASSCRYACRSR